MSNHKGEGRMVLPPLLTPAQLVSTHVWLGRGPLDGVCYATSPAHCGCRDWLN